MSETTALEIENIVRKVYAEVPKLSSAEIELLITKYFNSAAEKIADRCIEIITSSQRDCEAYRLFRDKDNVVRFYETERKLNDHIGIHKKKEAEDEKKKLEENVMFDKRYKKFMLIIALVNLPYLATLLFKAVQWVGGGK